MNITRAVSRLLSGAFLLSCLTAPSTAAYALKTDHVKYLDGAADGTFQPSAVLTRAQAASIVYHLMESPPQGTWTFKDVSPNAWYAQAAGALTFAGILPDDGTGLFRPDDPITRGECAVMLAPFLQPPQVMYDFMDLPDDSRTANSIFAAVSNGLFSGDANACFHPDDPLTRAETAVVFNTLLHRSPDPGEIAASPDMRVFPDVHTDHWAYAHIMEATTTHHAAPAIGGSYEHWTDFVRETARISDGFHNFDGWLYFVQDGRFLVSQTVGSYTFDANGRAVTGNAALDETLAEIIRTNTASDMSRDQKLRALHNYLRDHFTYIKRDLVTKDQTGWEPAFAAALFADGRGNCFSFAAAFQQLARAVGVEARVVVGELGSSRQPHGWVEIDLDGSTFLYDAELEMSYRGRGQTYDLFQFQYSTAPFTYWK